MAFTIGKSKVLNLPEQVEENRKNIAKLIKEQGTKITVLEEDGILTFVI